jgi:hypothetical protein
MKGFGDFAAPRSRDMSHEPPTIHRRRHRGHYCCNAAGVTAAAKPWLFYVVDVGSGDSISIVMYVMYSRRQGKTVLVPRAEIELRHEDHRRTKRARKRLCPAPAANFQ